ncbi:WbqC family protein [Streptomyces decoyicus]|uniref:WbqC family protein n=1 Tax=Streptomyces decoyicus TaxID=249567 RepID=UPI00398D5144
MPPTNPSSRTASTAASSRSELPPPGGLCAIHQPNLFPRLSTLAKLFAADCWIVLDDVRFTRRDYQHRTAACSSSTRGAVSMARFRAARRRSGLVLVAALAARREVLGRGPVGKLLVRLGLALWRPDSKGFRADRRSVSASRDYSPR